MSVATGALQYVLHLLFDTFEGIFHVHYILLNLRIIGFRANGIDFPAYFLAKKVKLFSLTFSAAHQFTKILQVVLQTHLLFADVETFNIVNHFLLEAIRVEVVVLGNFLQVLLNTLAYVLYALWVQGVDFLQVVFYSIQLVVDGG